VRDEQRSASPTCCDARAAGRAARPGDRGPRADPRALPREEGYIERDGVRVFWERYGDGEPTIFFLPTWSIVHSRIWRSQIAYFARHVRVLTMDGRGCGRSDRPTEPAAYEPQEFVADALAAMDASGTERAILVSLSWGTVWNLVLAALRPDRVQAAVFMGPTPYAVSEPFPAWATAPFNERLASYDGFSAQNRYFILEHYREFIEFWARACTPEPHSVRLIELGIEMGLSTTPEVILATLDAAGMDERQSAADRMAEGGAELREFAARARCPVLVVQGELDAIAMPHWAQALATDTRGELVVIEGAGHIPQGRKPVCFNLELRRFIDRVQSC
jgi:pimeloyl-ACP methyl ester carboxylesterase